MKNQANTALAADSEIATGVCEECLEKVPAKTLYVRESSKKTFGLCQTCDNYPVCTFPNRGNAIFCEEVS